MAGMERFTRTVIATVSKYTFLFLLKAPSDGPLLLGTAETTSTSIVVVWGTVQCTDHNSNITGYMCYTLNSGTNDVMVSGTGESGGMLTLDELAPSTQYTIQVAAVSTDGAVGQFLLPIYLGRLRRLADSLASRDGGCRFRGDGRRVRWRRRIGMRGRRFRRGIGCRVL